MPDNILAGLAGLSSYLKDENKLRKEEFEKEKQKVSASRIAVGFKSLSANNTESDARQLVYSLISDAASLDSLDANLPLIDSLYRDSVSGIKNYKAEKQDKALREYAQSEYGMQDAPQDLTGSQVFDLAKHNKSLEQDVNSTNLEGQKLLTIYDHKGRVKFEKFTDERTSRDQLELNDEFDKRQIGRRQAMQNSLKSYAGITESGLPLLLGQSGLMVQQGGKLVTYNEAVHGLINKGNSYNANPYQDATTKLNFWQKENKSAYQQLNASSQSIASALNLTPQLDASGKNNVESYFSALTNTYKSDKAIWTAYRNSVENEPDENKRKAMRNIMYDQFIKFKEDRDAFKATEHEIDITNVEAQFGLPMDSFKDYNESGYNLLSQDTSPLAGKDVNTVKEMISLGQIDANVGTSWLLKYHLNADASAKNIRLNSDEEYQEYYNRLGYQKKGNIFSQIK